MAQPQVITTRALVDRYEALYQKTDYGRTMTVGDRMVIQSMARMKNLYGVKTALDVGCGRGGLIRDLTADGFQVTGTEIVPWLLSHDLKGESVYPYGVEELGAKFEDDSYDVVILKSVLDHLATTALADQAIAQAARIAKVGVIAIVWAPSDHRTLNVKWTVWEKAFQATFRGGVVDLTRERDGTTRICGRKGKPRTE